MNLKELQEKAQKACEDYQAALVDEYGEENAGDARYKYIHKNPSVQALASAYKKASSEWHAEVVKGHIYG